MLQGILREDFSLGKYKLRCSWKWIKKWWEKGGVSNSKTGQKTAHKIIPGFHWQKHGQLSFLG